MKTLVTGGSGFLGRYVVEELRNLGVEVISVDINDAHNETEVLDITDFLKVSAVFQRTKPEVVIHLAALTGSTGKGGGTESIKDPFNYLRANVLGTLCVFESCRLYNVKKLIQMSSASPYGLTKTAITETTPLNPTNPYGFSKACADMVATCYALCYGIKTVIFRAPLLCGEGQKELNALREFVLSIKKGEAIVVFGKGEHVREWLHPKDVVDAFLKALTYFDRMSNPYEVFVLGNKPISMRNLAELIIKTAGRGHIEYSQSTKQVFDQYTNARKAKVILGWEPRISTDDIIRRVVKDILES